LTSGHNASPSREALLGFYETMLRIRRFEEQMIRFVNEQKMPGSTHTCIGQEAIAAGICGALQQGDQVLTTHRPHGHFIAMGLDIKGVMAELMLKQTGINRGRCGSMHLMDPDHGILGANGVVGGGVPLAVGAAYAAQVRRTGQVIVVFFGDGASSQGGCHEAMNLASLWKLPVIFVCENNGYAEMTPSSSHISVSNIALRAPGYGMAGVHLDGNDVIAVAQAAAAAVGRARSGEGPTLIDCQTFRLRGHFEGDPERYRPTGEKKEWSERDPIRSLATILGSEFAVGTEELEEIDSKVKSSIAQAAKLAEAEPDATGRDILEFVYAGTAS
jgi:acetoin:2,6-dichlorophenolindophenol oxidoreductase subunit alpha